MAWIKSFQELRDHPKTKRAARLLGIPKIHLVGHLHGLWWWTSSYAEDGSLAGYSLEDISEAAEWNGDPTEFVAALLDCGINGQAGFLERDAAGELVIHDWDEYAGKLVERRIQERERQRNKRATTALATMDVDATLTQHTADVGSVLLLEEEKKKTRSRTDARSRAIAADDVPEQFQPFDRVCREWDGYSPSIAFFEHLAESYSHFSLQEEAVKATEWLRLKKKRKCTTPFLLNWLSNAAGRYAARGTPNGQYRPNDPPIPPPSPAKLPDYGRTFAEAQEANR